MGKFDLRDSIENTDLLIYSLMICIINLDTNLDGQKTVLEKLSWVIIITLISFNCILLGFLYSGLITNNINTYFYMSIGYPFVSGLYFRIKHTYNKE